MKSLLAGAFLAALASASPAVELRVTVYNHAQIPAYVLDQSFGDLRRIFRLAGIAIQIIPGDPEGMEGVLMTYPEPPKPGFEQEASCRARRDIALRFTVAEPGQPRSILGMALPMASRGLNVVVYDDRVRQVSAQHVQPHGLILAHVIAHEIGHVLLRSNIHEPIGMMSRQWMSEEYTLIARGVLAFSRLQSRTMRASVEALVCPDRVR